MGGDGRDGRAARSSEPDTVVAKDSLGEESLGDAEQRDDSGSRGHDRSRNRRLGLTALLPRNGGFPRRGCSVRPSYGCPPHPGCPQSHGCDVPISCCSHRALQKRLSFRLSQVHGGWAHFIAVFSLYVRGCRARAHGVGVAWIRCKWHTAGAPGYETRVARGNVSVSPWRQAGGGRPHAGRDDSRWPDSSRSGDAHSS
jgi:hypothetical protein